VNPVAVLAWKKAQKTLQDRLDSDGWPESLSPREIGLLAHSEQQEQRLIEQTIRDAIASHCLETAGTRRYTKPRNNLPEPGSPYFVQRYVRALAQPLDEIDEPLVSATAFSAWGGRAILSEDSPLHRWLDQPDDGPLETPVSAKDTLRNELELLIADIEGRAKQSDEYAESFNRGDFPSSRKMLQDFIEAYRPGLYGRMPLDIDRFGDHLRSIGVKFKRGAGLDHKGRKFFRTLYPDCTDWE
jgi:hypothetical protein